MAVTDTQDTVPMDVLDTIISGYRYPTGWLHDALRGGDRSLVYEVHAQNLPGLSPGYFWMYAGCEPDKVDEVHRLVTEQFDKARAGAFTEEELERARSIIATTELMSSQSNSERAMQAALDELYGLGYDYRDGFAERVRAVTLDDVRRVARKYLTTPVTAVVTPAPDAVEIGIAPTEVDQLAPGETPEKATGG
jgi:zinc protease